MDNETFQLCKSVYEKTRWGIDEESLFASVYNYEKDGRKKPDYDYEIDVDLDRRNDMGEFFDGGYPKWVAPLYTSDYLLEKLPARRWNEEEKQWDGLWLRKWDRGNEIVYFAEYWTRYSFPKSREANTPLKALLKLTLALHEAGELTTKDEIERK